MAAGDETVGEIRVESPLVEEGGKRYKWYEGITLLPFGFLVRY